MIIYHWPREVPSYYIDKYKNGIYNIERTAFAAMVTCLDERVGNVTKTLKQMESISIRLLYLVVMMDMYQVVVDDWGFKYTAFNKVEHVLVVQFVYHRVCWENVQKTIERNRINILREMRNSYQSNE